MVDLCLTTENRSSSRSFPDMDRAIVGFHQDDEKHWVADLECGHTRHARHDPPWQNRQWVTTAEGRARFLGTKMNCVRCDQESAFGNASFAEDGE